MGYCVVVVSEGVHDADGKFLADAGTKDAFGHTQLGGVAPVVANMVREAHGYKYHWAVPDYLQRASRHIASKVDVQQAYAMGKAAVELAVSGHDAVMPTIIRKKSKPYKWVVGHVALSEVANVEKKLPRDYITEDGFGITREVPRLSAAADRGRGLPAVQERPARLREDQGRCGEEEAQHRVQALSSAAPGRDLGLAPILLSDVRDGLTPPRTHSAQDPASRPRTGARRASVPTAMRWESWSAALT